MSNMPHWKRKEDGSATAQQMESWREEEVKVEYQGELHKAGNFPNSIPLMKNEHIVDAIGRHRAHPLMPYTECLESGVI